MHQRSGSKTLTPWFDDDKSDFSDREYEHKSGGTQKSQSLTMDDDDDHDPDQDADEHKVKEPLSITIPIDCIPSETNYYLG